MTAAVRPPMPYFGGKQLAGPTIAGLLPPHAHYVEPFCGSLAVLLAKPPSVHETVNDLDRDLMTFWRVLRDRPDDLERACALTPHSRAEHRAAYEEAPAGDEVERARRVWVRLTQGRTGTQLLTGWRHYENGTTSPTPMPTYLSSYVARLGPCVARLARVSLECGPALDVIAKYGDHPSTLLYVDPPYLGTARGRAQDGYPHEMRTEAEHRELADALHACKAAVVVSGYPCDLYDRELYPGWDRRAIAAGTGQGEKWHNRTEVLWSNRPLGAQMTLDLESAAAALTEPEENQE